MTTRKTRKGDFGVLSIKLHSIDDLREMFPEKLRKDIKVSDLEKLVEQHGTYRQVGKVRVLTDTDIRHFFARIAAAQNTATPVEPAANESGLMVAIGDPAGATEGHAVFVSWCPVGDELILLDQVKEFCDEQARIINTVDITYGDYMEWRSAIRTDDNWSHGKWYYRTQKVMRIFQTSEGD